MCSGRRNCVSGSGHVHAPDQGRSDCVAGKYTEDGVLLLKVLVIPDVHLKDWMFDRASYLLAAGKAERAVCLMDIPDDWGQEFDLKLYKETFERAVAFARKFPETLWCYGNHDLSYVWNQPESGYSHMAGQIVNEGLRHLREALADESRLAYIHRIDDVLFLHGGLCEDYVKVYLPDVDPDATDEVIAEINRFGCVEMWREESPVWFRPQLYANAMYRENELLQVVGHTPVQSLRRDGNVISCDVFSTDRSRQPYGTQEFLLIDTETWEFRGIK